MEDEYDLAGVELSEAELTVLDKQELDFAIVCAAPVKVAIQAINNRPGTVAIGIEAGSDSVLWSAILVADAGLAKTTKRSYCFIE